MRGPRADPQAVTLASDAVYWADAAQPDAPAGAVLRLSLLAPEALPVPIAVDQIHPRAVAIAGQDVY